MVDKHYGVRYLKGTSDREVTRARVTTIGCGRYYSPTIYSGDKNKYYTDGRSEKARTE